MIIKIYNKYKEIISYAFFGGCTTLVNVLVYFICTRLFNLDNTLISTIIAWCVAVIFAYITNRKFVFKSDNTTFKSISIEFGIFISCRLFTGAMDVGIMYVFVDLLGSNDLIIKIVSNIFVIIFNYIASRLIIFNHHKSE